MVIGIEKMILVVDRQFVIYGDAVIILFVVGKNLNKNHPF